MPRTKVRKAVPKQEKAENSMKIKVLEALKKMYLDTLDKLCEGILEQCKVDHMQRKLKIAHRYRVMTIVEAKQLSSFEHTTLSGTVLSETTGNKKKLRSSSCHDEGYRTTDSGTSTGSRQSRSRSKKPIIQSKRTTRSLSRTEKKKTMAAPYKTPSNKNTPPETYGLITPKCKPNTPQVLLRRPKQGEMALSMAGSPLLTVPMLPENTANINIPFSNGHLLSLQPQRGLRLSQIPTFDDDTLDQLKTLNEHLAKIVEVQSRI